MVRALLREGVPLPPQVLARALRAGWVPASELVRQLATAGPGASRLWIIAGLRELPDRSAVPLLRELIEGSAESDAVVELAPLLGERGMAASSAIVELAAQPATRRAGLAALAAIPRSAAVVAVVKDMRPKAESDAGLLLELSNMAGFLAGAAANTLSTDWTSESFELFSWLASMARTNKPSPYRRRRNSDNI